MRQQCRAEHGPEVSPCAGANTQLPYLAHCWEHVNVAQRVGLWGQAAPNMR